MAFVHDVVRPVAVFDEITDSSGICTDANKSHHIKADRTKLAVIRRMMPCALYLCLKR